MATPPTYRPLLDSPLLLLLHLLLHYCIVLVLLTHLCVTREWLLRYEDAGLAAAVVVLQRLLLLLLLLLHCQLAWSQMSAQQG